MKNVILKINNEFEATLNDIFDCTSDFLTDDVIGECRENNISKDFVLEWINTSLPEEDILSDMFAAICCVDSSNLKEILIENFDEFYQYFVNKHYGSNN